MAYLEMCIMCCTTWGISEDRCKPVQFHKLRTSREDIVHARANSKTLCAAGWTNLFLRNPGYLSEAFTQRSGPCQHSLCLLNNFLTIIAHGDLLTHPICYLFSGQSIFLSIKFLIKTSQLVCFLLFKDPLPWTHMGHPLLRNSHAQLNQGSKAIP
jgi:hypothetical protein